MPWAELADVRMYYELLGSGEPVLLIPGLGATCRMWDPVAPELAEHVSLIMPDNRNVGKSVGRRKPRNLGDLASDMVELLDYLQVEKAHVIGISLGGVIAQRLAIEHAERINRLVLISTAHRFGPYLRDVSAMLGRNLHRLPYALFQRSVELLGTAPAFYDSHIAEVNQKIESASTTHGDKDAVTTQLRCLAASEVEAGAFRISAPTLVLAGEYDALIPNCYARRMADEIPGSRFHILSGCGHNPLVEAPEVAIPTLIDFLNANTNNRGIEADIFAIYGNRLQDIGYSASYDRLKGSLKSGGVSENLGRTAAVKRAGDSKERL
jgi:3-oxoadipate enol-lactonase